MIDVTDVRAMRRLETADRARAHTTALDDCRYWRYVFLPETLHAAVFVDGRLIGLSAFPLLRP